MVVPRRHPLDVSVKEARQWQERLQGEVSEAPSLALGEIKRIAGTDISYLRDLRLALGAAVLMSFEELDLIEQRTSEVRVEFPYVPGLLSFRELPALLPVLDALEAKPDIVMVDGQGVAHPRGIGLASHLGLLTGLPTIGCAKSRLVGEYREPGCEVGDWEPLLYEGRKVGAVLRTRKGVKPLFISVGHKVDLELAIDVVLACCRGVRLPEPQRRAHRAADEVKKDIRAGRPRT